MKRFTKLSQLPWRPIPTLQPAIERYPHAVVTIHYKKWTIICTPAGITFQVLLIDNFNATEAALVMEPNLDSAIHLCYDLCTRLSLLTDRSN